MTDVTIISATDDEDAAIGEFAREIARVTDPMLAVEVVVADVEIDDATQTARVKLADPTQQGTMEILVRVVGPPPSIGELGVLLPVERSGSRLPGWRFLSGTMAASVGDVWTNTFPPYAMNPRSVVQHIVPTLGRPSSAVSTGTIFASNTFYFPIVFPTDANLVALGFVRNDTTSGTVSVKVALFPAVSPRSGWEAPPYAEVAFSSVNATNVAQSVAVSGKTVQRGRYWIGIKTSANVNGPFLSSASLMAPSTATTTEWNKIVGLYQSGTAYATPWASSSASGSWSDANAAFQVFADVSY